MSLSVTSTYLSNISRDSDFTTSLGSLFQCLTTLLVRNFFLIFNLNCPWCNLRPFSLAQFNVHDCTCLRFRFPPQSSAVTQKEQTHGTTLFLSVLLQNECMLQKTHPRMFFGRIQDYSTQQLLWCCFDPERKSFLVPSKVTAAERRLFSCLLAAG